MVSFYLHQNWQASKNPEERQPQDVNQIAGPECMKVLCFLSISVCKNIIFDVFYIWPFD